MPLTHQCTAPHSSGPAALGHVCARSLPPLSLSLSVLGKSLVNVGSPGGTLPFNYCVFGSISPAFAPQLPSLPTCPSPVRGQQGRKYPFLFLPTEAPSPSFAAGVGEEEEVRPQVGGRRGDPRPNPPENFLTPS